MKPEDFGYSKELQEMLKNISRAYSGMMKELQVNLEPTYEALRKIGESVSSIKIPKFQLPVLSQIDWEDFNKRFAEECNNNAKYGWCMSSEMSFSDYRRIGRSEDRQDVKDQLFTELFEANNFSLYEEEKREIISGNDNDWKEFYSEVFQSIEADRIRIAIPSLVIAIEHELSEGNDTDKSGKPLIKSVQLSIEQDKDPNSFTTIIAGSIFSLLKNKIFERGITGPRSELINRNRILHGRDNPSAWTKTDVYRLMTIISAIRMLHKYK